MARSKNGGIDHFVKSNGVLLRDVNARGLAYRMRTKSTLDEVGSCNAVSQRLLFCRAETIEMVYIVS
eukprot:4560276-Pleurochrysis_carterae.AAC.1